MTEYGVSGVTQVTMSGIFSTDPSTAEFGNSVISKIAAGLLRYGLPIVYLTGIVANVLIIIMLTSKQFRK